MSPSAPACTPCLLTGLALMALNAYFLQLSPVSFLWSPLQAAVPVLHWTASWWFVSPGWEPNLVSLAPSLTSWAGGALGRSSRNLLHSRRQIQMVGVEILQVKSAGGLTGAAGV
ncbi:hypothetical protein DSO57_1032730 [Entomophthora muscae]|uniref:Uncharacterized protein n=1 Tax=Entomophthora muscae TaxID=34485 RepID=A0ACC2S2F2_9FUNG|nr:hypothetical protein DSO57_1032730 [Entomophthora muscae]